MLCQWGATAGLSSSASELRHIKPVNSALAKPYDLPKEIGAVPSLFVIRGRDQGTRFELDASAMSIGRDRSNSIQLHDTEISRRHAVLRRKEQSYVLTDQRSSNGTFINGQPVTSEPSHELSSGDQVQVGQTLLLYTGFSEATPEDLSDKIRIVGRHQAGGSSHIVRSMKIGRAHV